MRLICLVEWIKKFILILLNLVIMMIFLFFLFLFGIIFIYLVKFISGMIVERKLNMLIM